MLIISVASLIGVLTVPFLGKKVMTYLSAFLVALGVSALACDAVLHLIPHVSGSHAHLTHPPPLTLLRVSLAGRHFYPLDKLSPALMSEFANF